MQYGGSKRVRFAVTAVVGGLLLSACASGAPSGSAGQTQAEQVYAKFNGMSGQARHDALVKAAKEEGVLNLSGSPTSDKPVTEAFTRKYGIEVSFYNALPNEAWQRFLREQQAGRQNVDVITNSDENLAMPEARGFFSRYESPAREQLPPVAKGDVWTGVRRAAWVVGYNTKLLPPNELPDSLTDFAQPQWKGKISLVTEDWDWFMAMNLYYQNQGMTDAEITDMFSRIAANAHVMQGHTEQAQQLAAGRFAATMSSFTQSIDPLAAEGAPVTWGRQGKPTIEPIVLTYTAGALVKNAAHPAAAMLYMDFMLSDEASEALREAGRLPAIPGPDDPLAGLETIPTDLPTMLRESDEWIKKYDAILRHAT